MATQTIVQRAFSGGELSPSLAARADLQKYHTGLRRCQNFMVQRHGGVTNRPGTRYVASTKTLTTRVQFMRYVSEVPGESVLIECGHLYFRFFVGGAPVLVGGVPYEVAHPFPAPALCRWAQSGSIITLTHPDVPPHELQFNSLTDWVVTQVETKPGIDAPHDVVGDASVGDNVLKYSYKITAADKDTYEESEPSEPWEIMREIGPRKTEPFNLYIAEADKIPNAAEYYIYLDPFRNGIYGYLATRVWGPDDHFDLNFHDIGFPPDFSQTPPVVVRLFEEAGEYPAMCAYYQQRRWFANSRQEPETVWGSRIGFPRNFGISSPLQDDDSVTFRVVGEQRHPVQHLIALGALILLTDRGEWIVQGSGDGPLIPTSIQADQFGYWGASPVVPVLIGKTIIYVQARGRIVRDLVLDASASGLNGRDLTLFAGHLFDGHTIVALDFAQNPHSIVWVVRSDGLLLGLTYLPDDEVWGWSRHHTGAVGKFVDVCVVPEHDDDAVYLLVTRRVNGLPVRYIERMASRLILDVKDSFFVDAGLSYSGLPVTTIAGMDHLEGEIVAVVGDGQVVFNGDPAHADSATYRVVGGAVTLPAAYSVIHAGLPIRFAEIETLDLDAPGSSVRDKRKRVQGLTLLVERSSQAFLAGSDREHLLPFRPESWQASTGLVDDAFEVAITAAFTDHGRTIVRQDQPLPLTILGLLPTVEIGG